jgi:chromosome segregation ATPase
VQKLRQEAVDLEGTSSRLQNELTEIETRERANDIRRERLIAEKTNIGHSVSLYEKRYTEMQNALKGLQTSATQAKQHLAELSAERETSSDRLSELRNKISETESLISAENARVEIIREEIREADALPSGTKALMDGAAADTDISSITGNTRFKCGSGQGLREGV